jgi:hypothetical protein
MAFHNIDGRKVRTSFEYPPIPVRKFDWFAVDDSTYDGEGPIGMGATEQDAIEDLLDQIADEDCTNDYTKTNGQFGVGA